MYQNGDFTESRKGPGYMLGVKRGQMNEKYVTGPTRAQWVRSLGWNPTAKDRREALAFYATSDRATLTPPTDAQIEAQS